MLIKDLFAEQTPPQSTPITWMQYGMVVCLHCGRPVPADFNQCSCGQILQYSFKTNDPYHELIKTIKEGKRSSREAGAEKVRHAKAGNDSTVQV